MTAGLFLFGTLLDPDLRAIVMGQAPEARPARLADHRIRRASNGDYPLLDPSEGATVDGLLLPDPGSDVLARVDYYEAGFGFVPAEITVECNGPVAARIYRPDPPVAPADEGWTLEAWQDRWAPLTREAAVEAMAWFGRIDGAGLRRRMPTMRMRADARLRAAADPAPNDLGRGFAAGEVAVAGTRRPYAAYFAVREDDLTHPRFAGGRSPEVTRGGFLMGDAATVLPYDPASGQVLVIEQFRYGPFLRGDPRPWCLEPIAGRVDPGETPERTARREAEEEAGLSIDRLLPVARYYPSPGAVSEYIYSYVGLADLSGADGRIGGVADENEDIRTRVLPLGRLIELISTGEAETAPLVLTALWLDRAVARGEVEG